MNDPTPFDQIIWTAATRLSRKLNTLQLARMLGIKDPRILMVYYNETAEDIARRL